MEKVGNEINEAEKINHEISSEKFIFHLCSGTYEGNARLSLFLMGYPKDAYTTKFREFKREGKVFYYPLNDLQVASGRFGLIKCEEKLGLKFCSYYGYG